MLPWPSRPTGIGLPLQPIKSLSAWAATDGSAIATGVTARIFTVSMAARASPYTYPLGSGVDPYSVAYVGTSTSGLLAAGDTTSNTVVSVTGATSGSDLSGWTTATKPPSYSADAGLGTTDTQVTFKPGSTSTAYTVYASTASGTNVYNSGSSFGSGLFVSSDLNSFNGLAFLSVSNLSKVAMKAYMPGPTTFCVINDDDAGTPYPPGPTGSETCLQSMLFQSTDNGASWQETLNLGNTPISGPPNTTMNFATDKTIFIAQGNGETSNNTYGNRIEKSTDAGATWSAIGTPNSYYVTGFAVVDANTYWIGSSHGVQLSTSSTMTALPNGETPCPMFLFPGMFVIVTDHGNVDLSTDNGATWTILGSSGQLGTFPPLNVAFDLPNKIIYAQGSANSGNIMKWQVGTDTSWSVAMNASQLPAKLTTYTGVAYNAADTYHHSTPPGNTNGTASAPGINGIGLAPNGIWYISTPDNPNGQIWRSIDAISNTNAAANGYHFEAIPSSDPASIGNLYGKFAGAMPNAAGNNETDIINNYNSASSFGYSYQSVESYTETLLNAPTTTAPAASAVVDSPVSFSWGAINYSGVQYELQIAFDSGFTNLATSDTFANNTSVLTSGNAGGTADVITSSTVFNNVDMAAGTQYYWRVRVAQGHPIAGQWSKAVGFTTKLTSSSSANTPGIDSAGESSRPTVLWMSV